MSSSKPKTKRYRHHSASVQRKSMFMILRENLTPSDKHLTPSKFFSSKSANYITVNNHNNYKEVKELVDEESESTKCLVKQLMSNHDETENSFDNTNRRTFVRLTTKDRIKVKKQ